MSSEADRPGLAATVVSVAALLLSVAFLITGNGLQTMLLPIRGGIEGFAPLQVGLLGTGYFLGFVAGCLVAPRIIIKVGHVRAFAALVSIASCSALGHPVMIDPWAWVLLRALSGFCLAGLYLVIESWLAERATNETRGTLLSIYVAINFSVITVGQMLVTLFEPTSFVLFTLASVLVSLAAVPIALTTSPQPAPVTIVHFRPRKLYRISPAGVVGVFVVGLANGAFWSLGPVFGEAAGGGIAFAAQFMSVAVIGGAIAQWPVGKLSDSVDRRLVMIGLAAVSAASGLAVALVAEPAGARLAIAFLFGAATLSAYAIAAAHTFDFADRADFVEVSSGLLLLNGLGSAVGPLVAAPVMAGWGVSALFLYNLTAQALLIGFVLFRMRQRVPPPEAERAEFDLAATAPVVALPDAEAMERSPDVVEAD